MARSIPLPLSAALIALPCIAFGELNGWFNGPLFRASPPAFWAVDATFNIALPVLGAWFLSRYSGAGTASYGLRFPPPLANELFGASLFFGFALFLAFFIPHRITWMWLGYPDPAFSYGQALPGGILRVPAVLYLAVTAGLVESAIYIGLPWLLWRNYFGASRLRSLFPLASAIVFASVHWEQGWPGLFGALVFGYAACRVYLKIADLWPIVGAHVAIDLVVFW